ncbi:MAG TPA: glycosyltransferase 87 family protein [Candidatus Dormibacteraeota bacterium]|nr:glycosyltransferase 87 family protein [Candidatus Dormibacteraeota bacterium]
MNEKSAAARASRLLIVPLAAVALIPVLLTELGVFPIHDLVGDAIPDTIVFEHGAQGLLQGNLPYSAHFLTAPYSHVVFVYPPLSLLLMIPPLLAGSKYSFGFAIEMILLLAGGLWLLAGACRRAGVVYPVALTAAALMVAVGPALVTRVDGLQGLGVAAAALALRSRRFALAVALVTVAALVKETVVVAALPIVVWALWPPEGKGWTEGLGGRAAAVGLGLIPAAVILVTFLVWSQGRVLNAAFASLHRGVEIESVPATVDYLLRPFFRITSYTGQIGSVQVSGRLVSPLAAVVAVAGVAALIWGSVHFARARRRPVTAVAFAIAVAVASTPVLSPQYLLALLPVLVLAATTEFGLTRANVLLGSGFVMAILTQIEFPDLFSSVVALDPLAMAIVALRNLLLIAIAVNLARADRASTTELEPSAVIGPTGSADLG